MTNYELLTTIYKQGYRVKLKDKDGDICYYDGYIFNNKCLLLQANYDGWQRYHYNETSVNERLTILSAERIQPEFKVGDYVKFMGITQTILDISQDQKKVKFSTSAFE